MPPNISPLAYVDPRAELGEEISIGPFCHIGPHVTLGDGCRLDGNVTIVGHTTVGRDNRFFPGCVIGGEPQDIGYKDAPTRLEIGDGNIFREGVTVNRGAEKEDHITRIGHGNFLMANSHVAHNCHVFNHTILCNGVLLGGHVHVHDYAIVSGNSVVHHFATLGTLSFVSGGCRVPQDVPPYMLSAGSDDPQIITVNIVGMRRRGISEETIQVIKQAYRLIYREHKSPAALREIFQEELGGIIPMELSNLLHFIEQSRLGKQGRAREVVRMQKPADDNSTQRKAA